MMDHLPELEHLWPLALNGAYEPQRVLARGGYGVVVLAHDRRSRAPMAVKLLDPGVAVDPVIAERFQREAQILARLSHPHILRLVDFGAADGKRFLVLPFVEGLTLRKVIRGGPLEREAVLRIAGQLARALVAVHRARVTHRDLKPENVLVDAGGTAFLTDFGLSRSAHGEGLTAPGMILGTPGYIPPDVIREGPITAASDMYALGVIIWEMFAGHRPFQREPRNPEISRNGTEELFAACDETPERPSYVSRAAPRWIDALVLALLDPDPARRPTAAETVGELERLPSTSVEETLRIMPA